MRFFYWVDPLQGRSGCRGRVRAGGRDRSRGTGSARCQHLGNFQQQIRILFERRIDLAELRLQLYLLRCQLRLKVGYFGIQRSLLAVVRGEVRIKNARVWVGETVEDGAQVVRETCGGGIPEKVCHTIWVCRENLRERRVGYVALSVISRHLVHGQRTVAV